MLNIRIGGLSPMKAWPKSGPSCEGIMGNMNEGPSAFAASFPIREIPWTAALSRAAKAMGYEFYFDVPGSRVDELKRRAKAIQGT